MENVEEKKAYGGCLSILLPLWIIGQIFTLITNVGFAPFFSELPLVPILLIGANIVALIGIILLLQFKKIGFYIFILTYVLTFITGFLFPDYVDPHIIFKSIFGLGLFLILMCFKNKETKLNGFQTLGIFKNSSNVDNKYPSESAININDIPSSINSSNDISEACVNEDSLQENLDSEETSNSEEISNDVELKNSTDIITSEEITGSEQYSNDTIIEKGDHQLVSKQKNKKLFFILVVVLLIVLAAFSVVYIFNIKQTDDEVFVHAKSLIEQQKYEEGIAELESIQQDYIPAKALLGKLYTSNDTIERNYQRGELLLKEAYQHNDTIACDALYSYYLDQGKLDSLEIIGKKMVELNYSRGVRALLVLYFNKELGGKQNKYKDHKKAEYLALNTAKKNPFSSMCLGHIYYEGEDGVEKDFNKTFYWWNKCVQQGFDDKEILANCYSNLGHLYHNGYGVKQDLKKAYECYKKSILYDSDEAYSYSQLAWMFKNSQYVKYNRDSVIFYLQKAADNGDEEATVELENDYK